MWRSIRCRFMRLAKYDWICSGVDRIRSGRPLEALTARRRLIGMQVGGFISSKRCFNGCRHVWFEKGTPHGVRRLDTETDTDKWHDCRN